MATLAFPIRAPTLRNRPCTSAPACFADFPALLALNEESVHFLSPLSAERLNHLHSQAALHLVLEKDGQVLAFVLAFREGVDYDSPNYVWFSGHYPSFLYIDRVVVAKHAQGLGTGSLLYREVFAHARATGVALITCEFDIDPPNPVSEQFHRRFGFQEVGKQAVAGGKKWVSLQAVTVGAYDV